MFLRRTGLRFFIVQSLVMFRSRGDRLSFFVHREFDGEPVLGAVMALWCTIRTFAKHALELGNQPLAEPIFFIKPDQCLHETGPLPVSQHPGEMHHEVECVVKIGANGEPVALAVGLDLTDRPAQSKLRAKQWPWAKGKCFRSSAVIGQWHQWNSTWEAINLEQTGLRLELTVNGDLRQSAFLSEMSVPIHHQMASLSEWAPVQENDVLFTGTPSGVAQLVPGDALIGRLIGPQDVVLSEITMRCE